MEWALAGAILVLALGQLSLWWSAMQAGPRPVPAWIDVATGEEVSLDGITAKASSAAGRTSVEVSGALVVGVSLLEDGLPVRSERGGSVRGEGVVRAWLASPSDPCPTRFLEPHLIPRLLVQEPVSGPSASLGWLNENQAARWDIMVDKALRAGLTVPNVAALRAAPDHPEDFAVWLVALLGASTRSIAPLERMLLVLPEVWRAAAEMVAIADPEVEVVFRSPGTVSDGDASWLIDHECAAHWENPVVQGVIQPRIVLRPLVRTRGEVLLEGEVA